MTNDTRTVYDGYTSDNECFPYPDRDAAEMAVLDEEIVRWESREITQEEYLALFAEAGAEESK